MNIVATIIHTFAAILLFPIRKWKAGGVVPPNLLRKDLSGKTVLITGANQGIGFETALALAKQNARILIGCRDERRARDAVRNLKKLANTNNIGHITTLDLSSFASIRNYVKQLKQSNETIDILINNAGLYCGKHGLSVDGYERQFATNHLGHFLLTKLLLDDLLANKGRIITVASRVHAEVSNFDVIENPTSPNELCSEKDLYSQSKLANVLFAHELNNRYESQGLVSYSLNPGGVLTSVLSNASPFVQAIGNAILPHLLKTPSEGAQTSVFAALVDVNQVPSGSYLSDCAVKEPYFLSKMKCVQKELWKLSERAVQ
jgi:NAD(P)-dependent dehydrogenase (short-subunit alcohol dehydrogenase family)